MEYTLPQVMTTNSQTYDHPLLPNYFKTLLQRQSPYPEDAVRVYDKPGIFFFYGNMHIDIYQFKKKIISFFSESVCGML
jgi:hypothetical protein